MDEEARVNAARRSALRALGRSDRSSAALRDSLSTRFGAEATARALEQLAAEGWLDDRAAATRLATRMLEDDLLAPALVRTRLLERGFAPGVVEEVVSSHPVDENEMLRRLIARVGPAPGRAGRLFRRLCRAGYDPELVSTLLPQATED